MRNPDYSPDRKYDIMVLLEYIFEIIGEIQYDEYFLVEEIAFVSDDFKPIMHRFIFKTGDIDEGIFNGVFRALLKFYRFLVKHKLVSAADYNEMKEKMLELKPELLEKMRRYNEIRYNDDYSEEEKEDIREELFDGDHAWPFF